MSVVTPIHYNYFVEQYDVFGRPLRGYAYCDFSNPNSLPCIIALAVIDIGIMFLATYQAWGSRNLATEYSETKVRWIEKNISKQSDKQRRKTKNSLQIIPPFPFIWFWFCATVYIFCLDCFAFFLHLRCSSFSLGCS